MTRSTLSLLTLACVSVASLTLSISRDQAEPLEPKLDPTTRSAFDRVIHSQLLSRLNPQLPAHERMTRVLRPTRLSAYSSRIVAASGDGLFFDLIYTNRSKPAAPVTTTIATGKFTVKNGAILLWDDAKDEFVPAALHPQVLAKTAIY